MTVRVYRWDDSGAPVLTGNAADYTLIDVLDKCLVAGYGSKAAAGWSKEFTGTGKAVFRQGAGSNGMRLRVDCSASSQTPRLRGFVTMSNVDTGTGPFPTDGQISGGGYAYVSSTTDTTQRAWCVIADEQAFYLYIGYNDAAGVGLATTTNKPTYFFGDLVSNLSGDAYDTMLICNAASTVSSGAFGGIGGSTAHGGHFLAGPFTQSANSATALKRVAEGADGATSTPSSVFANSPVYPEPITGGLILAPMVVAEVAGYVSRGKLPGAWAIIHSALVGTGGDTVSGSGALSGKTFLLLESSNSSARSRVAIETSDTWR